MVHSTNPFVKHSGLVSSRLISFTAKPQGNEGTQSEVLYMKKICLFILLTLAYQLCSSQNKAAIHLQVNWEKYLSQHDMLWAAMPKDYFEGPFAGNGLLGAILFKDDQLKNTVRFEIGRTDVFDHRTAAPSAYETSRLPIGQLLLTPVGEIITTNIRTDLWNAEIRAELVTTAGSISFRCFVPSSEELIVVNMKTTGRENKAKFSLRPQKAQSARYIAKRAMNLELNVPYEQNPPYTIKKINGIEVVTQPLLMGDDYATAWKEIKNTDQSRTVFITVANRWGKYRKHAAGSAIDAVATIQAAQKKQLAGMEKIHRDWWHNYYPASFVTIPDARLESFYWIQLYKLASATHPNRPVIDLLGPWFKPTSWPLVWMNLNVQLTYYTLGITNHADLEKNLYDLLERHKDQLIQNVPKEFQNDCAGIRNPVGFDDLYNPMFLSEDPKNDKELNIIVLPWLMQMYYLHNRRNMDDTQLRTNVYPLLKRAFNVYLRILYKGDDGLYHIPYTYSDEYGNAKETSLNIALARWGFKTLIDCATRLHLKDPLLPRWKETLSKMADYNINENGIMVGKDLPFAKPHRHYSHLFSIFPLYEMTIDNATDRIPMMKRSIQHYTDLDGDNCIYKFSGASSLWAAMGEGDSALHWLQRSLEMLPRFGVPPAPARIPTLTQNTFYSERENPTFESPISSSRCILDMMLQDWEGWIRVFPSMPSTWKNASFYNLRTQGAFLVSAVRENGATKFIHIKSLKGAICIIKTGFKDMARVIGPPTVGMTQFQGLVELTLKKGEEAVIYTGDQPPSLVIKPTSFKKEEMNSWGVNPK